VVVEQASGGGKRKRSVARQGHGNQRSRYCSLFFTPTQSSASGGASLRS
jgi:hypothetical protein